MNEMMKKYAALVFDWAKQNHGTQGKDKVLLVSKNGTGKWINADGKYSDTKSKTSLHVHDSKNGSTTLLITYTYK